MVNYQLIKKAAVGTYKRFQSLSPSQGSLGLVTANSFITFWTEFLGSVNKALCINVFVATKSFILLSMMSWIESIGFSQADAAAFAMHTIVMTGTKRWSDAIY